LLGLPLVDSKHKLVYSHFKGVLAKLVCQFLENRLRVFGVTGTLKMVFPILIVHRPLEALDESVVTVFLLYLNCNYLRQ